MPYLKSILTVAATDSDFQFLRGKAMEAISIIGYAVGKTKFCDDCVEVLNLMLNPQRMIFPIFPS